MVEQASPDDIALIATYNDAATRRDADAAVAAYSFPIAFVAPSGNRLTTSPADLRAALLAAWARYDADGITDVSFTCGRVLAIGEALRQLEVRWLARRADGSTALDATTWYFLQRTANGWRISGSVRPA